MKDEIQLLQFIVCKDFRQLKQDQYIADGILSNLYTASFPFTFGQLFAVTCWRKDQRFHKEVIEYTTEKGTSFKSQMMDIEPVTNNIIFRWHKHQFPANLQIDEPTVLTVRVILDWKVHFETYIMVEKAV